MRILITNLLAVTALLFSAVSASAYYDISMTTRPGSPNADLSGPLTTSDTITVDIFFSTDQTLMQQLAIGVVTPAALSYDAAASTALPVIYPAPSAVYGTTGAQAGYILYAPQGKAGGTQLNHVGAPIVWPAPAPGTNKTNVNFQVPDLFTPTIGVGDNIWVASLVFHLDSAVGGDIALQISGLGSVLRDNNVVVSDDPNAVGLSASLTYQAVPEPATAALIGFGVLGLAIAGRRK